jgi:hypothetical protein
MNPGDFLQLVTSALLALNLWQLTGLRSDMKDLTKTVGEHDKKIAAHEKVFQLNGCETPDPGCRR